MLATPARMIGRARLLHLSPPRPPAPALLHRSFSCAAPALVCGRRQSSAGEQGRLGFGLKERRGDWRSSREWRDCITEDYSVADAARQQCRRRPRRYWLLPSLQPSFPPQERFIMMSYSILSTFTVKTMPHLFKGVPKPALSWYGRKSEILKEIQLYSPDVICFQEVDHFEDLKKKLQSTGYDGVYKGRTGESKEGCATFWRKDRFCLLQQESITFHDFGLRNNVAQLCVLQSNGKGKSNMESNAINYGKTINKGRRVIVGNIHILFNPRRGEIKLAQIRHFLEKAHILCNTWNGVPMILGGNFNIAPTSGIYEFLATATLDVSGFGRRYLSGFSDLEPSSWEIRNTIKLQGLRSSNKGFPTKHVHGQASSRDKSAADNSFEGAKNFVGSDTCSEPGHKNTLPVEACLNNADKDVDLSHVETDMALAEACGPSVESQSEDAKCPNECTAHKQQIPVDDHIENGHMNVVSTGCESMGLTSPELSTYEWSTEELETATGNASSMIAQHKWNLRSVYADVHGPGCIRDVKQELLMTFFNRKFKGTVDYLWYSEGLQPLRVLDVVPIHVLRSTRGLLAMGWPSDHLALACELAFTEGAPTCIKQEVENH